LKKKIKGLSFEVSIKAANGFPIGIDHQEYGNRPNRIGHGVLALELVEGISLWLFAQSHADHQVPGFEAIAGVYWSDCRFLQNLDVPIRWSVFGLVLFNTL